MTCPKVRATSPRAATTPNCPTPEAKAASATPRTARSRQLWRRRAGAGLGAGWLIPGIHLLTGTPRDGTRGVPAVGGGGRNRTAVRGFAGPCLNHSATPPEAPGDPIPPGGMLRSVHADRTDRPTLDTHPPRALRRHRTRRRPAGPRPRRTPATTSCSTRPATRPARCPASGCCPRPRASASAWPCPSCAT